MELGARSDAAAVEAGERLQQDELVRGLQRMSDQVIQVVPDCVGMSVAFLRAGVSFTLVSTDSRIAMLDGIQYVDGGPCVDTLDSPGAYESSPQDDSTDERRWQRFAQSCAASAIGSTLTLTVRSRGEVTGSVNLYAASTDAFHDRHEALADVFRVWAPGAVTNADLALSTRVDAGWPGLDPHELATIDRALDVLQQRTPVDRVVAGQRLRWAAIRAGVTPVELAAFLVEAYEC